MSLKPIVVLLAASCGAREEHVAEPQPLPPHVDVADAAAPVAPVCFVQRDASDFASARARFEAKDWVDAAAMFRAVAFASFEEDVGIYAAQLYLESLNQLVRDGHRVCLEDMERDVPALHGIYCGARRARNEEPCALLDRVHVDVGRLHAETLEVGGDHAKAAATYLTLVQKWCVPASKPELRCDELAFNAAVSFLTTGDEAAAKRIRAIMVDPKNKMDKSPLVEKLDCRIDPTSRPRCH